MNIYLFAVFLPVIVTGGENFLRRTETSSAEILSLLSGAESRSLQADYASPTMVVDNNNWLRECVPPFKNSGFSTPIDFTNYYLRDMKYGLCADHLACAFVDCTWTSTAQNVLQVSNLSTVSYSAIKNQLPTSNLPSVVTFPRNVLELVSAVKAAKKQGKGLISVKTSGHSYHGSSTMRTSTQINLRSFTRYAASGIKECQATSTGACVLARARGKKAIIRIGGGEPHDHTYRAVLDWNTNHANKYTIVGGGAGTVGAAGGWLQGGGLSTGLERHYGFGVDQILEIEMVLADGTHVKFGPTKWETKKGFIYPRTTVVTGYCNSNLVLDESQWKWHACPISKAIPFSDLWFAVRGGGGGSYGIVTKVQAQLHEFQSVFNVYRDDSVLTQLTDVYCATEGISCQPGLANLFTDYFVDLFWNPKNIGLNATISNSCGNSGITFSNFFDINSYFNGNFFMCEGRSATDAVIAAWKKYVTTTILPKYPGASIENFFTYYELGSYAELVIQKTAGGRVPQGHLADGPPPGTESLSPQWSAIVPIQWLVQKNDDVHYFLMNVAHSCHLMGGDSNVAHDQTTSVNPFQRVSGLQCGIPPGIYEEFYRAQFIKYFKTKDGSFPGGTEYNHISPVSVGPLKTNWTVPCPIDSYTKAQQAQKCVSLQESVWGTKILSRLTATKKKVDPDSSFNCHFCVGEKSIAM